MDAVIDSTESIIRVCCKFDNRQIGYIDKMLAIVVALI